MTVAIIVIVVMIVILLCSVVEAWTVLSEIVTSYCLVNLDMHRELLSQLKKKFEP